MTAAAVVAGARSRDLLASPLSPHVLPNAPKAYPIGLELFSVRRELARDLPATLSAVSKMGYQVVEFYAPYLGWTIPYAKGVRTQLDDLGLRCYSTHNPSSALMGGET
ncbi:MAG: xylose isomerase, partial [Gemmatimonadetes bacterium]